MIPPILHQILSSEQPPAGHRAWRDSWVAYNPGWRLMSWTDRALLEFVAAHYPDFLKTYCDYRENARRAEAGRTLLLHHFGGVYADADCECVAPLATLADEVRVVLCKQPPAVSSWPARLRGLPYLLSNAVMASPAGHPFWPHLLSYLPNLRRARETVDATGAAVLTSAQLSFPDQAALAIRPDTVFAQADAGRDADTLAVCHAPSVTAPRKRWSRAFKRTLYRAKYLTTRGKQFDRGALRIDPAVLTAPPPSGGNIAVLVPVRDAAEHIAPFLAAVEALDHPTTDIKLVFCEGDSKDGSWELLRTAVEPIRPRFRDIVLLRQPVGTTMDRATRTRPKLQRERRGALARVRNHLIAEGLDDSDDWALWIDIDVWRFPPDIVRTLMSTGERIVVPSCLHTAGGKTFDFNSFIIARPERDHRYYRSIVDGLYQPPAGDDVRLSLSDVRHLERVELDGVGGTMLLVDASLHRAGLLFPELPYKDMVETEGFGVLARDLGVTPVGLPRVEIFHVPW